MLDQFLEQLRIEAFDAANAEDVGDIRLSALLESALNRVEEAGVFEDYHVAFFNREGGNVHAEVHAYAIDTEDDVLILYYLLDANAGEAFGSPWSVQSVAKDAIDRGFRRMEGFMRLVRAGRLGDLEESQPAYELKQLIEESIRSERTITFGVIATGTVSDRAAVYEDREGVHCDVWDLLRLSRISKGLGSESLTIDFVNDFGCSPACLVTPPAADGIQVLLTCLPAEVLGRIYNTYRARLLERNVRSFLQFSGKINKGIRETLLTSPSRFLAYNNGLAATASSVSLERLTDGVAHIRVATDFQIVNGGQTTASIASAIRRDQADLGSAAVAMKLTIVPVDEVDALVPLVSRYANTQNRIQEADFSANHPWHVALERLSRETWTTPSEGAPRGTRWYYERSRGQYADDLAALATAAAKRRFRQENPPAQKLTKTDLAKFTLSWDQLPAIVSKGGQKCFIELMSQLLRAQKPLPNAEDLKRIACQSIIFHAAERFYGELDYSGYRANVVTFSVARLSNALERRLPWEKIWQTQKLPAELVQPLKTTIVGVREVIIHPPGQQNITEWSKRHECWSAVLELPLELDLPDATAWEPYATIGGSATGKPLAQGALLEAVTGVSAEVWFAASKWAKETGSLQAWQRGLSYSLGNIIGRKASPTAKQATQGRKLLLAALDLGFEHLGLSPSDITRLRNVEE